VNASGKRCRECEKGEGTFHIGLFGDIEFALLISNILDIGVFGAEK